MACRITQVRLIESKDLTSLQDEVNDWSKRHYTRLIQNTELLYFEATSMYAMKVEYLVNYEPKKGVH